MALMYDHVQADTIAAIATAMSEAGIGIIRISGPSDPNYIALPQRIELIFLSGVPVRSDSVI